MALEFATSSPAAGRIPDWTAHVVKEITAVRDAWDQHVEHTEKPDGLYEEIVTMSPRLSGTIDRLRGGAPRDHRGGRRDAGPARAGRDRGLPWPLDDARDDLQRLIGKVIRHRQKGADLVWEAYNVDIGGPE